MITVNKLLTIFPVLFYPIINIIVLFLLGFGLTFLILPKSLKPFWLWLSPWTTIITSIFYFVVLSLIGFSVNQVFIPYILILLGIDIYVLIKVKLKFYSNLKQNIILVLIVSLTLIFNLSPLIRNDKMLTTVSMGNNDIITYAVTGDYLKNHSIAESFKTKVEGTVDNLLHDGRRWGTPIINSFFLTILNLQGYQYSYISQVVLFSLFLPLLYILFTILYGKSSRVGLIIVSIFAGFNSNLLYILYHDFFGQVLFYGIEILIYIFIYSYFSSPEIKNNKLNTYDFILGILIAVLFFSYHEPAVFMFAPLGIFLLVLFFLKKEYFIYYLKALLKVVFVSMVMGNSSIARALIFDFKQAFMGNSNQPIGWQLFRSKIPFANPFEAMGFWSIHNFEPITNGIAIVLSIIVVLIIFKGLIMSRHRILSISYIIIFLFFYYWTGLSKNDFFAFNRALTYTLPFIIILFSIGLVSLYEKHKYFWKVIMIILISLELWSAINLIKRFIRESFSVDKSYLTLKDIQSEKRIINEPLYLENDIDPNIPYWNYIWIRYFLNLNKFPITSEVSKIKGKRVVVLENNLVLIHKQNSYTHKLKILINDIIWENDFFRIGRLCNSDQCLLKTKEDLSAISFGKTSFDDSLLISGWSVSEPESRWAEGKQSNLRLVNKRGEKSKIIIEASTLKEPQKVDISVDDEFVGSFSPSTEFKIFNISLRNPLSTGVYKILFTFSNTYKPSEVFKSADNRDLSVNFKQIKLE